MTRQEKAEALIEAAWDMCIEQQHHNAPGWSMAKSWAWDKLREALAPFLVDDGDGVMTPVHLLRDEASDV